MCWLEEANVTGFNARKWFEIHYSKGLPFFCPCNICSQWHAGDVHIHALVFVAGSGASTEATSASKEVNLMNDVLEGTSLKFSTSAFLLL